MGYGMAGFQRLPSSCKIYSVELHSSKGLAVVIGFESRPSEHFPRCCLYLSLRRFSYLAMEKSIPLSGKLFAFLVIYEGAKLKPSQLQNAGK